MRSVLFKLNDQHAEDFIELNCHLPVVQILSKLNCGWRMRILVEPCIKGFSLPPVIGAVICFATGLKYQPAFTRLSTALLSVNFPEQAPDLNLSRTENLVPAMPRKAVGFGRFQESPFGYKQPMPCPVPKHLKLW